MSIGEDRVGLSFNPSGLPEITQIKQNCADLINLMDQLGSSTQIGEVRRLVALAQTKFEEGCMFAVKAIVKVAEPVPVSPFPEDNEEQSPRVQ